MSPDLVVIFFARAVISQDADFVRQFIVVGGDRARVAERAEIL
jgi:hypothetical protein